MNKEKINNIITNFANVEDIDEINNMIDEINSTLSIIRNNNKEYNINLIKSLYYIRGKLYTKRNKLARKRIIA